MGSKVFMTADDLRAEYELALRDYKQYVSVGQKYQTNGIIWLSRLNLLVYIGKTYYGIEFDVSYRTLQQEDL